MQSQPGLFSGPGPTGPAEREAKQIIFELAVQILIQMNYTIDKMTNIVSNKSEFRLRQKKKGVHAERQRLQIRSGKKQTAKATSMQIVPVRCGSRITPHQAMVRTRKTLRPGGAQRRSWVEKASYNAMKDSHRVYLHTYDNTSQNQHC